MASSMHRDDGCSNFANSSAHEVNTGIRSISWILVYSICSSDWARGTQHPRCSLLRIGGGEICPRAFEVFKNFNTNGIYLRFGAQKMTKKSQVDLPRVKFWSDPIRGIHKSDRTRLPHLIQGIHG